MSNSSDRVRVNIQGTFDVAIARNRLRQLADLYQLPTVLRARAAVAISVISDLVIFKSHGAASRLNLDIITVIEGDKRGVEFQFAAPLSNDICKHFEDAESLLERSCDEMSIQQRHTMDHVVMRLWSKRGRV